MLYDNNTKLWHWLAMRYFSYSFYRNSECTKEIKSTCYSRENTVPRFTNTNGTVENLSFKSSIT